MKSLFRILQILLVVVVLIAACIAFFFFRAWGVDARPSVVAASWSQDEVGLGNAAVLEIEIKAPWHRKVSEADPVRHPSDLIPQRGRSSIHGGSASLTGSRRWKLAIPMVATASKSPEGQAIEIALEPTRRASPRTVTVPVPPITVSAPESPDDLVDAGEMLRPGEDVLIAQVAEEATARPRPWWLLAILLLPIIIFLLVRWMRRQAAGPPPWERAQAELDALASESDLTAEPFFIRLTDILKRYTADRFETHSDAETSPELLESLRSIEVLPDGFPGLVRIADGTKFAGADPEQNEMSDSLSLVRTFISKTIPSDS